MTVAPRWRKVLRDIAESPGRSAIAVLAMAVGVFGLSAILTAYAILERELATTYEGTRPASAVLHVDDASDATMEVVRGVPGVIDAEARPVIRGRLRVGSGGDDWVPLWLFVIRDFDHLRMDTFVRDTGAWPPADGEVLLERTAVSVAQASLGDAVTVKTTLSGARTLRVTGIVHAAGLAPAWMEHAVYGFVTWTSIMRADAAAESAQIRIVVGGDKADITGAAARVRSALAAAGKGVSRIDVPAPGRHPHADQMDTFLFLLGAFGALTIALGAVMVATMIHAILTEQVRQIGSMKTIGASTRQIAWLYLGQVAVLAAVALAISLPLGVWAGRGYTSFAATILNATIASEAVPAWVFAVQIAIGFGVPLLVAIGPVYRASRITIQEAFSNDVGRRPFGTSRVDRWLAAIRWLPRPLMLSLRTTLHRRGRFALTIGTLAAGGVVFISAMNVSAAWSGAIARDAASRRHDLEVRLARPVAVATFAAAIAALPDVTRAEYWIEAEATLGQDDPGGRPRGSTPGVVLSLHGAVAGDRVSLVGPDADTTLLDLPMIAGRWLTAEDHASAVISPTLLSLDPTLHVGGDVGVRVHGRSATWQIVGIAKELFPSATIYAPAGAIRDLTGEAAGMARTLRVQTRRHDAAAQSSGAQDLDRTLARLGVPVTGIQRLVDRRESFEDHLVIIESALTLAAGLVVLVGGLGLASTLTVNVIERTREIGVLGAIGAGPRTIARQVLAEGLLMGVLSWGFAMAVAVPVTFALCAATGQMFIRTPIDFVMSPAAAATWLALVVVLGAVASFYPARRAARLTVREALTYA